MKKIFKILFCGLLMIALSCCQQKNDFDFKADSELSQYLDKEKILESVKNADMRENGPIIKYASDKYAVLYNFGESTLIYDFDNNVICGAIDTVALNMCISQGDNATRFLCNDEFLFIFNEPLVKEPEYRNGYVYSIKTNEMAFVEHMDLKYFDLTNPNLKRFGGKDIQQEVYLKLFKDKGYGFSVYPREDDIVVLDYGLNPYTDSRLYTISDDFEFIKEYDLDLL